MTLPDRKSDALRQLPRNRFAGAQGDQFLAAEAQCFWHGPFPAQQRERVLVARQAVEVRAEMAREAFELVERAGLLERRGVELDRGVRAVDAGTAAVRLLGDARVRRTVAAEKKFWVARGCRIHQRFPVLLPLEYRQAVVMRTDAAE